MTTSHTQIDLDGIGPVEVTLTDRGRGRPVLLLHGGGGPATVTPWADRLATDLSVRVVVPVHPGFDGTVRPEGLTSARGLAVVYAALLEALHLHDVTVIGNSIGGWVTAELALLAPARVKGYVLVDAVGIEVPGHPVADFFALTPAELAARSYADPERFGLDPSKLPPEALARMVGNRETIGVYAGTGMTDPTLLGRLAAVDAPVLVVWGEADRIGDPDLGRAFAAAVPGARFELLPGAGHLPQIETPAALTAVVRDFVTGSAG